MDIESIIKVQRRQIIIHRLIYGVFFLQRILLHLVSKDVSVKNTVFILALLVLSEIVDEICYKMEYFRRPNLLKATRYIQCLCATAMVAFLEGVTDSEIMIVALLLMFIVDFLLTMGITDKGKTLSYIGYVSVPVIVVLIIRLAVQADEYGMFLFLDLFMLLLVIGLEAYFAVEYVSQKEQKIFDQQWEFEKVVEKNENILQMQNKLKNTNTQLNLQKIDLQKANKKIKEANEEMIAQAEIMHYVASSFEVAKISNQITDAIMQVKKLGFCAVYIVEGAYLNKHANYAIKTNIGQLQSKIKECMGDIYLEMISSGNYEAVYHDNVKEEFPFLKDVNINSVYVKVLRAEDNNYGLFMIGDKKPMLFEENMSFYNTIIAQYDITLNNAKIYNEMQHMARKDGLTGINNRTYFMELFRASVEKIEASKGCISVALFDIDKFKSVNDTYGHLAGDEVIKRIAVVVEECIDKYNGFVCRYGGEEFVAVLPARKLEVAQPIIEELFDAICSQVVIYNEYKIPISVSIGLTAYPEICTSTSELLKRADWCMYYAKEHGRHQINVDDGSIQRE